MAWVAKHHSCGSMQTRFVLLRRIELFATMEEKTSSTEMYNFSFAEANTTKYDCGV